MCEVRGQVGCFVTGFETTAGPVGAMPRQSGGRPVRVRSCCRDDGR